MRSLIFSSRWLLVAALAVATLGAQAPPIGADAPGFGLQSLDGGEVRLSSVVDMGPAALVILRGYPGAQCPICSRQVHDFIANAEKFAEAGASVVFVYPGPSDELQAKAQEFMADKPFPDNFVMLLDPEYEVTNLYGVRWDEEGQTAYPSTFLIEESGRIFYQKISDSVGGRTSGAEMAELLF